MTLPASLPIRPFAACLPKHGKRSEAEIAKSPWYGPGAATASSPRMQRFRPQREIRPSSKLRLAIGTAMSAELLPEDIGRPAMVEKVADARQGGNARCRHDDPKDVHYVQTKTPLLTIETVREAQTRGTRRCLRGATIPWGFNGTTALGIAVALGEVQMPHAEQICRDLDCILRWRHAPRASNDAGADRAARQQGRRRRPLPIGHA